jgi:hypothetical protein
LIGHRQNNLEMGPTVDAIVALGLLSSCGEVRSWAINRIQSERFSAMGELFSAAIEKGVSTTFAWEMIDAAYGESALTGDLVHAVAKKTGIVEDVPNDMGHGDTAHSHQLISSVSSAREAGGKPSQLAALAIKGAVSRNSDEVIKVFRDTPEALRSQVPFIVAAIANTDDSTRREAALTTLARLPSALLGGIDNHVLVNLLRDCPVSCLADQPYLAEALA